MQTNGHQFQYFHYLLSIKKRYCASILFDRGKFPVLTGDFLLYIGL